MRKPANNEFHQDEIVRHVVLAMVLSIIALCMFQSSALLTLSYDLAPSPATERIVWVAERWHGLMQGLGVAELTSMIADQLETIHEIPVEQG